MHIRAVAVATFAAALSAVVPMGTRALAASDMPTRVLCAPAALHLSETIAPAAAGWNHSTIFLGTVHFTNTGPKCVLPASLMRARAEVSFTGDQKPGGPWSDDVDTTRQVLGRGTTVSFSVRVQRVPGAGYVPLATCPEAVFRGLLAAGPFSSGSRYLSLYPNAPFCYAYQLDTHVGSLRLGS